MKTNVIDHAPVIAAAIRIAFNEAVPMPRHDNERLLDVETVLCSLANLRVIRAVDVLNDGTAARLDFEQQKRRMSKAVHRGTVVYGVFPGAAAGA